MSAFTNEVQRLVESRWVAKSAVKSLEAFHKADLAKARQATLEDVVRAIEDDMTSIALTDDGIYVKQHALKTIRRLMEPSNG